MAINLPIVSKFDNTGVKQANGAFDGMGKKLAVLGGVIAGAFSIRAVVDFAKEATLAAEAIQTSGARIDQVAKSMGIFGDEADAVTQRLKDYANANEQLFATDENVIMGTQAKLLTFKELAESAGEMGGAFDRATQLAIDLAATGMGSAESNAIQLGKALNDPTTGLTALNRVGLTFTETQKEQIKAMQSAGDMAGAQEIILQALEQQVGGVAAATADASVKMGLAFGEVKESVGAAILPAFEAFTAAVLPLVEMVLPKIKAFLDENLTPALMGAAEAFSNFIGRIVEGESVGDIFAGIFDSIMGFFTGGGLEEAFTKLTEMRQKLIDTIVEALPGIVDGLVQLLPMVLEFVVGTMIPQMLEQFTYLIGELATLFGELMPILIDAFTEIVPDLIQSLADLLPMLVTTVLGMIPTLLQTAIDLFIALVDAVVEITPELIDTIVELLPELVDSIVSMLPGILDAAIELFTAIIDSLPIILPILLKAILDLMPKIIDSLISLIPALIDGAFQLFTGLITGLLNMTPQLLTSVLGLVPQIVTTLVGAIPQLVSAGFEVVSGFARGIIENAPRILGNAIASIGNTLVNGVKDFLNIQSPSKVFEGIGGDVVAGLKMGLDKGDGLVARASLDMAQTVKVSAEGALKAPSSSVVRPSIPMASRGNTAPVNFTVTVNAGMGADGNRIGQQIVDEIIKFERTSGRVFARA